MTDRTRKVRYAVVGAGNLTQVAVLPAFAHARENSELVALVSDDPVKQVELSKRYDLDYVGSYDELERVLAAARADAVYIATPNTLHRAHTERAARAGVHVLCEKPIAASTEDARAMIEATRAGRVKLMVAYRLHFEPANLTAMERTRDGSIGTPKYFSSVFSHQVRPDDIRTRKELGGGGLLDLGVYPINAARCLFRDEPLEVCALAPSSTDPRFAQVDETVSVLMRFPRGQVAQFTISQAAAALARYEVIGSEGQLRLDDAYEYTTDIGLSLTANGRTDKKTFARRDQFAAELSYFSSCILEDREPEPSGEEGLMDLMVVEAVFESLRTGKTVSLPLRDRAVRPSLAQAMDKPPVGKVEPVRAPAPSRN